MSEDEEENDGERRNCLRVVSWEDMSGYSILASWAVPASSSVESFPTVTHFSLTQSLHPSCAHFPLTIR
jgi:hypothetical protein